MKRYVITLLIIFIFDLPMYSQDPEIQELFKKATQKISEKDAFGDYEKPKSLVKLEKLANERNLKLENIGFFLYTTKPYFPAPIDIIPFASTGGDGCYFAFLTDFGNYSDLEKAPVLFVSPTDFDKTRPHQANILFAKNFSDFLSIMTKILNAEIIRFEDVTKMDFNKEIEKIQSKYTGSDSNGFIQKRRETIELLNQNFELHEIGNLNQYYISFYAERESERFIKTNDGIGIKTKNIPGLTSNVITTAIDPASLPTQLEKLTSEEKFKFYREAAYLYSYHEKSFLTILKIMSGQMKRDVMTREAKIIDFEIMQTKYYDDYLKARERKNKIN